eukprot:TRINITY_DN65845_c2_g2_i1.p1 TRINITY_DN65845_c2_g2~~TRINITY_DN65845_c2_g2_i1.p1  ORF type:complete len:235 (-),score=25.78 TRINITY_DN65845_c2_g2_i1:744-1448(-)
MTLNAPLTLTTTPPHKPQKPKARLPRLRPKAMDDDAFPVDLSPRHRFAMLRNYTPTELKKHKDQPKNKTIHKFAVQYGIEQYKERLLPTKSVTTQTRQRHGGRVYSFNKQEAHRIGYTLRQLSRLPFKSVSLVGTMARHMKTMHASEAFQKAYAEYTLNVASPEPSNATVKPALEPIANQPSTLNPNATPFSPQTHCTTSSESTEDDRFDTGWDEPDYEEYDPYLSDCSFDLNY